MIGRVIEEEGQKVVQTLAGATAGTVCKVNYSVNCNYAIPITPNELGEGYVGLSCCCPGPYYNPATGTLTVDNICSKSSEAENADKVKSNSLSGDTVYNMAMWCATSDGCYNSIGFSGGRSITYNPYTATLNAYCGNFTSCVTTANLCIGSTLVADGLTIENPQGCFIGCIAGNGKLAWDCGANFAERPVCITNLTVTDKINGSICKADGTNCWNQYCMDYMCGNADRPLLMTSADNVSTQTPVTAGIGRSTNCWLTFNPYTGVMKRCCAEMGGYTLTLVGALGGTRYALIDVGLKDGNVVEGKIYSNTFSLVKYCGGDAIYRHSTDNYGDIAFGHINDTSTCVWFRYSAWVSPELFGQKPIKLVCSTTTAPDGITFTNSISNADCAGYATSAGSATNATNATNAVNATNACAAEFLADGCNLSCIYAKVGCNNEFNIHNSSDNYVWFNYRGGVCAVKIGRGEGNACLGTLCAAKLYAGEDGIETHYDVNGYCDDSANTNTWYIYCDGSACFNGDVEICGNFYAGVAVIGTNNINIGCYSTVCGNPYSTAIGYCAKSCVRGFAAIGNCAEAGICCGITYAATIEKDHELYGRHGKVHITIPSCNMYCNTWCGMAHIIANVINKGRCTCTWTASTTCNIPNLRFGAFGYWWNDGGSTDGCIRYNSGNGPKGIIAQWAAIQTSDAACGTNTVCQYLYSCHCSFCIPDILGATYNDTGTWGNGANFELVF